MLYRVRLIAVCLAVILFGDLTVTTARAPRPDVTVPASSSKTWVIVGVDDRTRRPDGPDDLGGQGRGWKPLADIIIVVTQGAAGTRAFSVPRDTVERDANRVPFLLGARWAISPQAFVDALCTLGIPAGHLAALDLRGFVRTVDTVGGIDVHLPYALRDEFAHVTLPAGDHHVNGRTALALVRSRKGQIYRGGAWIADPEGAAGRRRRTCEVFTALVSAAVGKPWVWQSLAWRVLPDLSVDPGTHPIDLVRLRGLRAPVATLPTYSQPGVELAHPNQQTFAFLRARGLGTCHEPAH